MTTFVTSFININIESEETINLRLENFLKIVKTGVNLCVYVDSTMVEKLREITSKFNNVKIMKSLNLSDFYSFNVCSNVEGLNLPFTDNKNKDTKEYMILMNSKIEIIHDAITENAFNTEYFAWIDFSIAKIFSRTNYITILNELNNTKYSGEILAIPGCCKKLSNERELNSICWRFCGGFFFGDKKSLEDFYYKYIDLFPKFVLKYKMIVWEVNFWAWLECNSSWTPNWYVADHNDSIIEIPYSFTATSIYSKSEVKIYDYPIIDNGLYVASSASYVRHNGEHILNTRYVNYSIINKEFIHHIPENIIITKNVMSNLNDELIPTNYIIIDDPEKYSKKLTMYNGIEDIRLYEKNQEICFIGTSLSHSNCGVNSIVTGIYDVSNFKMESCRTITSPYQKPCEKNWTPIIINGIESMVYKWFPMEIFTVNDNHLEKKITYFIKNEVFRKFRGSSLFVKFGDNLLGLVHFSEGEFMERRYYHVLMLLDGESMKPIQYSESFYFGEEPGIEFCTGFAIIDMKYQFWVSFCDGSPQNVSISIDSIPLSNKTIFEQ
jgi:hypothetical protein